MKTESNYLWNASSSVRSTYTQDGAVLLDVEKGLCYSLNAVAARVWKTLEQLEAGATLAHLVEATQEHFEVSRDQLETDIGGHLEKLEQMGLVRRNPQVRSKTAP
jgi:hypothetical protein